jgi:hypothetical protein
LFPEKCLVHQQQLGIRNEVASGIGKWNDTPLAIALHQSPIAVDACLGLRSKLTHHPLSAIPELPDYGFQGFVVTRGGRDDTSSGFMIVVLR